MMKYLLKYLHVKIIKEFLKIFMAQTFACEADTTIVAQNNLNFVFLEIITYCLYNLQTSGDSAKIFTDIHGQRNLLLFNTRE